MIREVSSSTSANTDWNANTPSSVPSENNMLDVQMRPEMAPPHGHRMETQIFDISATVPRQSRRRSSEDLPRLSSALHENIDMMHDNAEPWSPLRGSQPLPPQRTTWSNYRDPRRPRSESEHTVRTRAGTTRSVASMDLREDGNRDDERASYEKLNMS